jgi:hypothetical protein
VRTVKRRSPPSTWPAGTLRLSAPSAAIASPGPTPSARIRSGSSSTRTSCSGIPATSADSVDREEARPQLARDALDLEVGRRLGDHADLDHVDVRGVDRGELEANELGRQIGAEHLELAPEVVLFPGDVDAGLELDLDHGEAVADLGLDPVDALERLDRLLDRIDHQLLEIERRGAREHRDDDEDRQRKRRILALGNRLQRRGAEREEHREDDQRELPSPYRERRDAAEHVTCPPGQRWSPAIRR